MNERERSVSLDTHDRLAAISVYYQEVYKGKNDVCIFSRKLCEIALVKEFTAKER